MFYVFKNPKIEFSWSPYPDRHLYNGFRFKQNNDVVFEYVLVSNLSADSPLSVVNLIFDWINLSISLRYHNVYSFFSPSLSFSFRLRFEHFKNGKPIQESIDSMKGVRINLNTRGFYKVSDRSQKICKYVFRDWILFIDTYSCGFSILWRPFFT